MHFSNLIVFVSFVFYAQDQVLAQGNGNSLIGGNGHEELMDGSGDGETDADNKALIGGNGHEELMDGSGDGETDADNKALPPECTQEYLKSNGHTMCMEDDARVIASGVSRADKRAIVNLHNSLRGAVQPPATDMPKLKWDNKIAAVAQKWAKQCGLEHDRNRNVPSYGMGIGQNVAAGYSDWDGAIMGWYNEVEDFKYGENPDDYLGKGGWKKIGHYTQVVQNTTFRIGCGFAECKSTKYSRYYVCNYGSGQTRIAEPYTKGKRASACPNSKKDGLCDCGGKMCLNQGSLNIDSCKCDCPKLFKGSNCGKVNCPSSDDQKCWQSVFPKNCKVSWVKNDCPYMCGVCGGSNGATPPPVFTSKFGCSFQGQRASAAACQKYGNNGEDKTSCKSRGGGQFGCDECKKYSNVIKQYCPVMCGLCDGPCDGKTCQNNGKLNRKTCLCECPAPYTGETCEETDCSNTKDSEHCWKFFKPATCKKYANVPTLCPWMCGICGEAGATPPPTFVSSFGCTYSGERKSKRACKQFGENGDDKWACASKGGSYFNCDSCSKYRNVKTDYCPVMCGMCDP